MNFARAYHQYGALNSYDLLKFVAALAMTLDHIGFFLYPDELWWRSIGRIAAPLYFFCVGFSAKQHIRLDVIAIGILLVAMNPIAGDPFFPINALVTIIVAQFAMRIIAAKALLEKEALMLWLACAVFALPTYAVVEYGSFAILFACLGYITRQGLSHWQHKMFYVLTPLSYCVSQYAFFDFNVAQSATMIAAVAIACVVMYRFEIAKLKHRAFRVINAPARIASRYSLYYYALHRVVLQMLG